MDFDFDAEQQALRDSVRTLLHRQAPSDVVRGMVDDGARVPAELWARLVEAGLTGLLVPEEQGGAGAGLVDAVVVLEEAGRLPLPGPLLSSAVVGTTAAHRFGVGELLESLAAGESTGTVAVDELGGAADPLAGVRTRATRDGDAHRLTGLKPVVPDGATADWVLVAAVDDDGLGGYLVHRPPAQPVPGLDPTRALARLTFDDTPAHRVGPPGEQTALWRRVVDDAGIALAAELTGVCDRAFELATGYAAARTQFGRPIGSFQVIRHLLADMLRLLTLARVGVHYAAWASDTEAVDREQAAAMAKAAAAEAAVSVTGDCIQIHGGVGFTWENDAHLLYKRAKGNDLLLGRQGWQRERLADLLLGPGPAAPVPGPA